MILSKQKALEIVNQFLDKEIVLEKWYQDVKPHLKAIILYGSVAKGTNREDSDIDIIFILPIEIEEKYTKGEYSYKYQDQEINIVIRSIEGLKKIASGNFDSFQSDVFRDSEIIWQKDDEAANLIDKIKNR